MLSAQAKQLLSEHPELCKEISLDYCTLKNCPVQIKQAENAWTNFIKKHTEPKRDWDIVAFYNPDDKHIWGKGEVVLNIADNTFSFSSGIRTLYLANPHKLKAEIHSVRRLSDGEVFTVGDMIHIGKIKSIRLLSDPVKVVLDTEKYCCEIIDQSLAKEKPIDLGGEKINPDIIIPSCLSGSMKSMIHDYVKTLLTNDFIPYQLCQKCNGDGHLGRYNSPALGSTTCTPTCDVCNGSKIIPMLKQSQ